MTDHRTGANKHATNDASVRRAKLRQFVGAYFQVSGWLGFLTLVLQVAAVVFATVPSVRETLHSVTNWVLLVLAGIVPTTRAFSGKAKRTADDILRRIELSDSLGAPISAVQVEEVREDALAVIASLASRQPLDLKPFASGADAGTVRLVCNLRESSWWSARLARELARWQYFFAFVFAAICFGVLYRNSVTPTVQGRDTAELAATLLVFVFAEGFFRSGMELSEFARASRRVFERAEQVSRIKPAPGIEETLGLSLDYSLARQAAPRLSTLWYRWRQKSLNAAWGRVQQDADSADR